MEKYPFKDEKCVCGFSLTGEESIVTGEKGDQVMGACPQCARALPLEVEDPEPEADLGGEEAKPGEEETEPRLEPIE